MTQSRLYKQASVLFAFFAILFSVNLLPSVNAATNPKLNYQEKQQPVVATQKIEPLVVQPKVAPPPPGPVKPIISSTDFLVVNKPISKIVPPTTKTVTIVAMATTTTTKTETSTQTMVSTKTAVNTESAVTTDTATAQVTLNSTQSGVTNSTTGTQATADAGTTQTQTGTATATNTRTDIAHVGGNPIPQRVTTCTVSVTAGPDGHGQLVPGCMSDFLYIMLKQQGVNFQDFLDQILNGTLTVTITETQSFDANGHPLPPVDNWTMVRTNPDGTTSTNNYTGFIDAFGVPVIAENH